MADEPVAVQKVNVRPSSARAPPKIASGTVKVQDNPSKGKGTSGVIIDRSGGINEDDEANEAPAAPSANKAAPAVKGSSKFVNEARNDGLVPEASQNINQQNDEEGTQKSSGIKMSLRGKKAGVASGAAAGSITGAAASTSVSGPSVSDVAALTSMVQEIAKNANPLGKSLEFITDDIESMNHELESWTKLYK